jgi:uncharacterized membrane protein YdjX (TVP38/TMEM64 family)
VSGPSITTRRRAKHEQKQGEVRSGESGSPKARRVRFGRYLVITAVFATVIVLLYFSPGLRSGLGQVVSLLSELDAVGIRDWVLSFGAFAPIVYVLVVVAQVIVSPIPAGPVTFAGAMIFGVPQGLALSMAGSVVGSVIVFAAARRWGKPLVLRLVGKDVFGKYAGRLDDEGWWVFVILLVPLMPDDAVCALAGLSAVSFRRFVVLMVVGRLPGATITTLLASDFLTGSVAGWITAGLVLVVLLALGFTYRRRLEGWIFQRAHNGHATDTLAEPQSRVEDAIAPSSPLLATNELSSAPFCRGSVRSRQHRRSEVT